MTVLNIEYPKFIFISFYLSSPSDLYKKRGKMNDLNTLNNLSFQRLKDNIDIIKNLIEEKINVNNVNYNFGGIISCPYSGHYTNFILNLINDSNRLNKLYFYFYNDKENETIISFDEDAKNLLNINIPYLLIYYQSD